MKKMQQKRYTEAFKLKVIEELETGKWQSVNSAAKGYNIRPITITKWIGQYNKEHLINRRIFVDTADERSELEQLRSEVRRLKMALKDQTVEYWIEHATVSFLCDKYGETRDTVKKKVGMTLPE